MRSSGRGSSCEVPCFACLQRRHMLEHSCQKVVVVELAGHHPYSNHDLLNHHSVHHTYLVADPGHKFFELCSYACH